MTKTSHLNQDAQCLHLFKLLIQNEDIPKIANELYYSSIYPLEWLSTEDGRKEQDEWNKKFINQIPISMRDEIKDYIYNDLIGPIMHSYRWGQEFPHCWSEWIIRQL